MSEHQFIITKEDIENYINAELETNKAIMVREIEFDEINQLVKAKYEVI